MEINGHIHQMFGPEDVAQTIPMHLDVGDLREARLDTWLARRTAEGLPGSFGQQVKGNRKASLIEGGCM